MRARSVGKSVGCLSRMRLMGIDFGGKRIGWATAEAELGLPEPRGTIDASGSLARDAQNIVNLARKDGSDRIVVGVPLDGNGETAMSRVCRMLGGRIQDLGLPVSFVDESLTSTSAESAMRDAGLKASKIRRLVDAEAACKILERYLESNEEA